MVPDLIGLWESQPELANGNLYCIFVLLDGPLCLSASCSILGQYLEAGGFLELGQFHKANCGWMVTV